MADIAIRNTHFSFSVNLITTVFRFLRLHKFSAVCYKFSRPRLQSRIKTPWNPVKKPLPWLFPCDCMKSNRLYKQLNRLSLFHLFQVFPNSRQLSAFFMFSCFSVTRVSVRKKIIIVVSSICKLTVETSRFVPLVLVNQGYVYNSFRNNIYIYI